VALFGRKDKAPAAQPDPANEDKWALGQGKVNGQPLIVRWDVAAKQRCPDLRRPIKVTIGIQFPNPKPNGLPSVEDDEHLGAMEEALFAELPAVADAAPVLVLTTNGMREWIVYAATHQWLQSWAPDFQERFLKGRPGKVEATQEPGWGTFTEWTK